MTHARRIHTHSDEELGAKLAQIQRITVKVRRPASSSSSLLSAACRSQLRTGRGTFNIIELGLAA